MSMAVSPVYQTLMTAYQCSVRDQTPGSAVPTHISPEDAYLLLTDFSYSRQRAIGAARVALYRSQMEANQWHISLITVGAITDPTPGSPPVFFLMDGYHRLNAVVESALHVRFMLMVLRFDSLDAMQDSFVAIDRGASRNPTAVVQATGLDIDLDMAPSMAARLLVAEPFITSGFGDKPMVRAFNAPQRAAWAREWKEQLQVVDAMLNGAHHHHKRTNPIVYSPVLAVVLATLRYQPKEAAAWWQRIAHNDALVPGTPEHTLHQRLAQQYGKAGQPGMIFAAWAAAAWNAHRANKPLTILRQRLPMTVAISGTPYTVSVA